MSEQLYEQSALPFRVDQRLFWINAEEVKKRHLLGRRIGIRLLQDGEGIAGISTTPIHTSDISELTDPNLRYALRLEDAAQAIGNVREDAYSSYSHGVTVTATNEGFGSRLLGATYSGVVENGVDSFREHLYRAAPENSSSEVS